METPRLGQHLGAVRVGAWRGNARSPARSGAGARGDAHTWAVPAAPHPALGDRGLEHRRRERVLAHDSPARRPCGDHRRRHRHGVRHCGRRAGPGRQIRLRPERRRRPARHGVGVPRRRPERTPHDARVRRLRRARPGPDRRPRPPARHPRRRDRPHRRHDLSGRCGRRLRPRVLRALRGPDPAARPLAVPRQPRLCGRRRPALAGRLLHARQQPRREQELLLVRRRQCTRRGDQLEPEHGAG